MRLMLILVIVFVGFHTVEWKINKVNNNLEKIIKLMEQKGEVK